MNLRQAAQRALKAMEDGEYRADMIEFSDALIALRAALAEPEHYAAQNPLGGPAKVFDAMADAIRAGDDYHATLRRYGFAEVKALAEPDYWQEEARRYAGNADYWRKRYEALAEPERIGNARCPRCWEPITAPTLRKPMTDAEIWNTYKNLWMFHPAEEPRLAGDVLKFARAIERAHGIGDQHE